MTSRQRRHARRAAQRSADSSARASASTSRPLSERDVLTLMRPGVPVRHKRTAQPAQPAGNGHGLSGWSRPATLPFALSITTSDRRWDMTANGSHR